MSYQIDEETLKEINEIHARINPDLLKAKREKRCFLPKETLSLDESEEDYKNIPELFIFKSKKQEDKDNEELSINTDLFKAKREPNTPEYIRQKGFNLGFSDKQAGFENLYKINRLEGSNIYFILGYIEGYETAEKNN